MIALFRISVFSLSLFIACCFTLQLATSYESKENDSVEYCVQSIYDQLVEQLFNGHKLSKSDKLRTIITKYFDLPWNSNIVLGKNRKLFTEKQLTEYYEAYGEFFINSTVSLLIDATKNIDRDDLKIVITKIEKIKDDEYLVHTKLCNTRNVVESTFRIIFKKDKQCQVRNFIIEGIDQIVSRRKEFDEQINNYGIDKFIISLKEKTTSINNRLSKI